MTVFKASSALYIKLKNEEKVNTSTVGMYILILLEHMIQFLRVKSFVISFRKQKSAYRSLEG